MDNRLLDLGESELETTSGGYWDWADFAGGLSWSLALGCFVAPNPVLCGGALFVAGLTYYS
jgi:hypothetical protein